MTNAEFLDPAPTSVGLPFIETYGEETATTSTSLAVTTTSATIDTEEVAPAAMTKHEALVSAHLTKLASINPAPTQLAMSHWLPPTPAIEAAQDRGTHLCRYSGWAVASAAGMLPLFMIAAVTALPQHLVLAAIAGVFGVLCVVTAVTGFLGERALGEARQLQDARAVTVPGPVAAAYRRIQSAATEIEDGTHEAEVMATARLTVEGATDMVTRINEHHLAGTLHTTAGQALCAEVCRLGAEMDAYLTAHNAHRFAPGEDDALAAVSATSAFTFAPTAPPALG